MILRGIDELERQLQLHPESNLFLIAGNEKYLCRQALDLIRQKLVAEEARVFDYSELDAREASAAEIREAANTYPMMSPRRLVVVTGADALQEDEERALLELVPALSSKTVLVLAAPGIDRRKYFYKQLAIKACTVELPQLKPNDLEHWVREYVKKRGVRISSDAVREMVDLAGSDLQSIANEIEKLIIYAGKDKSIPDSAISLMLSASRQHKIFDLTDALSAGNMHRALELLQNIMDMGDSGLAIVAILARHFRQLLLIKDLLQKRTSQNEIREALQVQAFVADKLLRQAKSMETTMAVQIYLKLADADLRFKSSRANHRMILESLICSLRPPGRMR